eukprot:1350652-Amorphochlora_amoeboformis.AAC.1
MESDIPENHASSATQHDVTHYHRDLSIKSLVQKKMSLEFCGIFHTVMATSTRYSFLLPLYATLSLASIAVRSRSSVMSSGAVAGPDLRPKNRLKRALEGLIFRLRHRREGDGRVMGVGVGSGKSGPPALNVYILGLEQTLMVDG